MQAHLILPARGPRPARSMTAAAGLAKWRPIKRGFVMTKTAIALCGSLEFYGFVRICADEVRTL
jgi:hypothetical protein